MGVNDPNPLGFSYQWSDSTVNSHLRSRSDTGYQITDINYDGVPELLVGVISQDNYPQDIYTVFGGKVVHLMSGYYRSSVDVLDNGDFIYYGSSGAMTHNSTIFRL